MISDPPFSLAPAVAQSPIGPRGKDSHRVTDLHVLREHGLLITQLIRNFRQVSLSVRHEQIFGLRAVDGVPKFPAADRATALRPMSAEPKAALAAGGNRIDQHTIANMVACNANA